MASALRQKALHLSQTTKPVVRLLYRSLLRQAKNFDEKPLIKVLWERPLELKEKSDINQHFYTPTKSFTDEIRRRFREPLQFESVYDLNKSHDLGFFALRSMSSLYSKFQKELSQLPKAPTAQVTSYVSSDEASKTGVLSTKLEDEYWAIPESKPLIRPGLFLVAHPLLVNYFQHSVIYICSHNEHGTVGLLLNKKLNRNNFLKFFRIKHPLAKNLNRKQLRPFFSSGGPLHPGWLSYLQSTKEGISFSTNKDLTEISRDLMLNPQNFRVYSGFCKWVPGQLEDELQQGYWFCATASDSFVFNKTPLTSNSYSFQTWKKMLQSMGGEYQKLVDVPEEFWQNSPLINNVEEFDNLDLEEEIED
jgi:putative transcriptional regulator